MQCIRYCNSNTKKCPLVWSVYGVSQRRCCVLKTQLSDEQNEPFSYEELVLQRAISHIQRAASLHLDRMAGAKIHIYYHCITLLNSVTICQKIG